MTMVVLGIVIGVALVMVVAYATLFKPRERTLGDCRFEQAAYEINEVPMSSECREFIRQEDMPAEDGRSQEQIEHEEAPNDF